MFSLIQRTLAATLWANLLYNSRGRPSHKHGEPWPWAGHSLGARLESEPWGYSSERVGHSSGLVELVFQWEERENKFKL